MRKRLAGIFAIIVMLSGAYICVRTDKNTSFREPEGAEGTDNAPSEYNLKYQYELLRALDESFESSIQEYPINTALYDSELDREYKTAFLQVLLGHAPIQDEEKGEYYFTEIIPDRFHYYYMDFDGDGFPELITHYFMMEDNPGYGGLYILKYNPREKQVYRFASADAAKWELLSSGKLYYNSSTDEQTSYGYREINALGEVTRELHFEQTVSADHDTTAYIVYSDESGTWGLKNVKLEREEWNELTQNFVKAQGDAPAYVTYEELFADLSVFLPEPEEVSDYTQANTDKFFKIAEEHYGFFHEHVQRWFDIVTKDDIFDGGVRKLMDLLLDDIDGNGEYDLVIMLRQPETEDKPEMGVLYFYMNGEEPYCFTDEDISVPLPVNICYMNLNRSGKMEIVFALREAGNGGVEDWYKAILSYTDGNNAPF